VDGFVKSVPMGGREEEWGHPMVCLESVGKVAMFGEDVKGGIGRVFQRRV